MIWNERRFYFNDSLLFRNEFTRVRSKIKKHLSYTVRVALKVIWHFPAEFLGNYHIVPHQRALELGFDLVNNFERRELNH